MPKSNKTRLKLPRKIKQDLFMALFVAGGMTFLVLTEAAVNVANIEVEQSQTSSEVATLTGDSSSGSGYIKFGDGAAEDPDPEGTVLNNGYTRESLLSERAGFGRFAGGRGDGSADDALTWQEYVVTNSNLNATGSGTLRGALSSAQRWITFKPGLTIDQATTSSIEPNNGRWVLDGRGASITIRSENSTNFYLERLSNWIMTNITFRMNAGASSSADMITNEAPDDWWIHKVTFIGQGPHEGEGDGALDTGGVRINGTNYRPGNGTVSWCKFLSHGKLSLAVWEVVNGETPLPSSRSQMPKYTYHHNLFRNNRQRQPLSRSSLLDYVNNWIDGWGISGSGQAVQVNERGEAIIRNNIFDSTFRTNSTNYGGGPTSNGFIKNGGGNLLTGGASIATNNDTAVFDPSSYYNFQTDTANQDLRDKIESQAGAQ